MDQERSILVVDDESDVVDALRSSLDEQGFSIRQARKWTEAIAEIQDQPPEMVLLDLYLPTVQGEALLDFIRDQDEHLPVVIVSSEIEPTKLEQLGRKGANGFVRKPFSEDDLFVVVQQILSEMEAAPEPAPQPDPVASIASPPPDVPAELEHEPGSGVERLELNRPQVDQGPESEPTHHRRRKVRGGRRSRRMRYYIVAFFACLLGTWLLFAAQEMFSQGFFGMEIGN